MNDERVRPNTLTRWRNRLHRARRRSLRAHALLCEAFILLGLARGAVWFLPFRRIAPLLGPSQTETATDSSLHQQAITHRVAWAIRNVSMLTPWESNCLAQAIAGKFMLRRRGVASTLYIGTKNPARGFEAHAWLRSGSQIVTGGPAHNDFVVLSTYGAPSPK